MATEQNSVDHQWGEGVGEKRNERTKLRREQNIFWANHHVFRDPALKGADD